MDKEKLKPLLFVGAGAVVLLLVLRKGSSGGVPEVGALPPMGDTPMGGVSSPTVNWEASETQRTAEALQIKMQEEDLAQTKALNLLEVEARKTQLKVYGASADLEAMQLKRQTDAVKSKPVSCPHGSEVRVGPDGSLYCRSSKGAVNLRNVVVDPAAQTVRDAVPGIVKGWLAGQGIIPPSTPKPSKAPPTNSEMKNV